MADTNYGIRVAYDDSSVRNAGAGFDQLAARSSRAAQSIGGVGAQIKQLAILAGGGLALRALGDAFVGYNSRVEQSTISLATQANLLQGGQWSSAMSNASRLFTEYQEVAKKSVGETTDFIDMHKGIQAAALQSGASMKQLTDIVIGATIASQVFGERADIVALDVKQMLAGTVGARDRFAQVLLASQKISQEDFNKSSGADRLAIVVKALNDGSFKNAAKQLETSFAGAASTLTDTLKILGGRIGAPLFTAVTAEIRKWNAWIEAHPQKIREFAEEFGKALSDGFKVLTQIGGWLAENRELLMGIGKGFLMLKGIQLGTGLVGGGLNAIGGLADDLAFLREGSKSAGKGLTGLAGNLGNVATKFGILGTAVGGAVLALQAFISWMEQRQETDIERAVETASIRDRASQLVESGAVERLRAGTATERDKAIYGHFTRFAADHGLQGLSGPELRKQMLASLPGFMAPGSDAANRFIEGGGGALSPHQRAVLGEFLAVEKAASLMSVVGHGVNQPDERMINTGLGHRGRVQSGALLLVDTSNGQMLLNDFFAQAKTPKAQKVNVNIKQEIRTNDPDRVAFLTKASIDRVIRAPTSARRSRRSG